jgi:hypothetical protein
MPRGGGVKLPAREILTIINDEPSYETFEYKGYKCMIHRVDHLGTLCGYVGVPADHPLYLQSGEDLEVHGGITFSNWWEEEKDGLWYLGFDCAHYGDIIPFVELVDPLGLRAIRERYDDGSTYKDIHYVRTQCKRLVEQLRSKS